MGDRNRRNIHRIDYAKLHSSGVRVPLETPEVVDEESCSGADVEGPTDSDGESEFFTPSEEVATDHLSAAK